MPHVNVKGIDWVVSVFIVHPTEPKVLLVDHKKLGGYFGVGGHVGDEDRYQTSDEAAAEEVTSASGLAVEFIEPPWSLKRTCPPFNPAHNHNRVMMMTPWAVELHDFPGVEGHQHMCLVYLARALSAQPKLSEREHKEIRWFSHEDLEDPLYRHRMIDSIRWYSHWAIQQVTGVPHDSVAVRGGFKATTPEEIEKQIEGAKTVRQKWQETFGKKKD